jgi:Fe-S cluster assembly protein SufD
MAPRGGVAVTAADLSFRALAARANGAAEPPWLQTERRAAWDAYLALGLPTTKLEAWKHTSLRAFRSRTFSAAAPDGSTWSDEELFVFGDLGGARLLFVDGVFQPQRSRLTGQSIAKPMSEAIEGEESVVSDHLGKGFGQEDNAFASLNTALFSDGALIVVPRGVALKEPIELVFASSKGSTDTAHFTRNVVVVERGAQATIIERYVGQGSADLAVSATETFLHEGAVLTHLRVHEEAKDAVHVNMNRLRIGRDGHHRGLQANLGGKLVRCETRVVFEGENGQLELDGCCVPRDREHMDTWTMVDHAVPHCHSRQMFKGVLGERARVVFNGKVLVRKDAQKTDAIQHNANLLLSDKAIADTRPQLEIYADDVRCTHGATVGQLDEDSLFYLRTRGIALPEARQMLTAGFAREVVDRVELEPVRAHVSRCLARKLMGA